MTDLNTLTLRMVLVGTRGLSNGPKIQRLLSQFNANIQQSQRFHDRESILTSHFSCLFMQPQLLEMKLTAIQSSMSTYDLQSWQSLANSVTRSDYFALLEFLEHYPKSLSVKKLIEAIETSNFTWLDITRTATTPPPPAYTRIPNTDKEIARTSEQALKLESDITRQDLPTPEQQKTLQSLHQNLPISAKFSDFDFSCNTVTPTRTHHLNLQMPTHSKPHLVVQIPTRGESPDVDIDMLIKNLDSSLSEAQWQKDQPVKILLGVNNNDPNGVRRNAQRINEALTQIRTANPISVDVHGYQWAVESDKPHEKFVPFGTIRNHLFDQLKQQDLHPDCRFISMDADTTLTPAAIKRVKLIGDNSFTSMAYALPESLAKAHPYTAEAIAHHWQLQAVVNQDDESLAYLAESCIIVGANAFKDLRTLRFEHNILINGATDMEGFNLNRNLHNMGNHFVPIAHDECVHLHNYERFLVPERPVKDTQSLIDWLASHAKQSQNMAGLDFFTRQLSRALGVNSLTVLALTQPLYIPTMLREGLTLKDTRNRIERLADLPSYPESTKTC